MISFHFDQKGCMCWAWKHNMFGDLICRTCWFVWVLCKRTHQWLFICCMYRERRCWGNICVLTHVTNVGTLLLKCHLKTVIKQHAYCILKSSKCTKKCICWSYWINKVFKIVLFKILTCLQIWDSIFFTLSSFTIQVIVLAYTCGKDCWLNTM